MRRLLTGAIRVGATRALSYPLAFVSSIALARLLGIEAFGFYSIFVSSVMLLTTVGKWGWDSAAIRFVSQYLAKNDADSARAYVCYAARAVFLLSIIVGAGYVVGMYVVGGEAASEPTATLYFNVAVAIGTLIVALSLFLQGVLRGQSRAILADLYEVLLKPVGIVGVLALALAFIPGVPPLSLALVAFLIVSAASMLGSLFGLRGSLVVARRVTAAVSARGEWWSVALFQGLTNLGQTFIQRSPVLVAGYLLSSRDAGLLVVALRLAELLQAGAVAVALSLVSTVASLYHSGQMADLKRVIRAARIISTLFALVVGLVMLVFGRWILSLFGPGFEDAYELLLILVAGQACVALFGPVGYLVTMTGRQRQAAVAVLVVAGASLPGGVLGAQIWGAVGISLVVAISTLAITFLLSRIARDITKADGGSRSARVV